MDFVLEFVGLSFGGRRKNNEDSVLVQELGNDVYAFGVADGMGGASAGEVASALAVKVMREHLRAESEHFHEKSKFHLKEIIRSGYMHIQEAIAAAVAEDPELEGMGTTFTLLLIYQDVFVWANLGDSRLYVFMNSGADLLTKDHTYIQDYIDQEKKNPDDEMLERYGNYLTRSLDGGENLADIFPVNEDFELLDQKSCFLLCSDGLIINKVFEEAGNFKKIVLGTPDVTTAGQQLISSAYFAGSKDNISVCLVELGRMKRKNPQQSLLPYPPDEKTEITPIVSKRSLWYAATFFVICCFIILILLLNRNRASSTTYFSPPEDSASESRQQAEGFGIHDLAIDEEMNHWGPLNQDDYRLPLNDSSLVVWKPLSNNKKVSEYEILVYMKGDLVEVFTISIGRQKVHIGELTKLRSGQNYELQMDAVMPDGNRLAGNRVHIKYN